MANPLDQKVFQRQGFPKGTVIFREGDTGRRAYIVQMGMVEIAKGRPPQRKVLGSVGPGSIFGEMALVDDQPRMAEAVAMEDTTCLVIGREQFRDKLDAADPFIRALVRILVNNIRSMASTR